MNEYEEYQSYQQPQEPRQPDPVMPEYQTPHSAPEKPKKKHKAAGIIALALCFSLIGGAVGAGGVMLAACVFNLLLPVRLGDVYSLLNGLLCFDCKVVEIHNSFLYFLVVNILLFCRTRSTGYA